MDKTTDLRVSRTHKLIKEAFFELMETVGFEKISVQALTKKAMVSRTTFYLHYRDKYDLLDQIEEEMLEGLKDMTVGTPIESVMTEGLSGEKPFALLSRIYEYVEKNQAFFKLIMGENGDPSFFHKLYEAIKRTASLSIDFGRLKIPEHYAIAFIIGIHTSIIAEWLKTGLKETPQEIASMIAEVMGDAPKNLYEP